MTEKRFIDGGAECIEDQFLVDTETDTYYWIDDGLDDIIELLNKLEKENDDLKEKLESLDEIIDNQIYAVKHTHKNCKKVGIAELKKLKKVLICNSIIQDGDVE